LRRDGGRLTVLEKTRQNVSFKLNSWSRQVNSIQIPVALRQEKQFEERRTADAASARKTKLNSMRNIILVFIHALTITSSAGVVQRNASCGFVKIILDHLIFKIDEMKIQ